MIELHLPKPPSVNRTRRINWAAMPLINKWKESADALTLKAWAGGKKPKPITGQFEATIILPETSRSADLDNTPKQVLDFARRLGLIVDDSPKYMRRVTIEFGDAPEGCRLIIRSI